MKPTRSLSRRSFLGQVAGGVSAVGGALMLITDQARALQITDSDPTDPVGQGRGGSTGITDRDPGDPAGRGRGGTAPAPQASGVTDRDSGAGADPVGGGRGGTGVTDTDTGIGADPIGRGRGGGTRTSDSGGERPENQERCWNNRNRLAELERQAQSPEGWSDAQLARARQERAEIDRQLWGNPGQTALRERRSVLSNQITRAIAAAGQRAELHQQIANHRTNLIALGCQ